MGLDFTHTDAHWAYGGFMRFRRKLAQSIERELTDIWEHDYYLGEQDAIMLLLDHSDCDGFLMPWACAAIAPRLREIVASWPNETPEDVFDRNNAMRLASGMELAAANNENLYFC